MTLILRSDYSDSIPLEVEGITPDQTQGKSLLEIEELPVFCGNRRAKLADFFRVSGTTSEAQIDWEGKLDRVHWIGAGMQSGSMRIHGPTGRHVGSRMTGGHIEAMGDVSDWIGGEMRGGLIHVHGDAGHLAGSAYRGSARGMTGGTLLIDGKVGNEVGHAMRRGLIAVGGDCGDLVGMNMLAGSLLVFGNCGIRYGAGMRRGTIALLGKRDAEPLPSFRRACRCTFEILTLIDRFLRKHQFPCPVALDHLLIDLFNGDLLEGGRGELLLPAVN